MIKFDTYTLQARLMPAYLTLLPIGVGLQVWLPEEAILERLATIIVSPAPIALLLSQLGRDRGYMLQKQLWADWGGAPTTQLLRHRGESQNPVTRELNRMNIRRLFPDLHVPTAGEEAADPAAADHNYEAATKKLISMTRDRNRFPLVYKENVNYGFRRNLWGLKPIGLILSICGAIVCVARWHVSTYSETALIPNIDSLMACSACSLMAGLWVFWINRSWVRIPAEAYAERLFEGCTQLDQKKGDLVQ